MFSKLDKMKGRELAVEMDKIISVLPQIISLKENNINLDIIEQNNFKNYYLYSDILDKKFFAVNSETGKLAYVQEQPYFWIYLNSNQTKKFLTFLHMRAQQFDITDNSSLKGHL